CIDNVFGKDGWYFSVVLHDCVVLLFNSEDKTRAEALVKQIYNETVRYVPAGLRVAISEKGSLESLPEMYKKTREAVKICPSLRDSTTITLIDASIVQNYNRIIRQVIQYVNENLSDSSLSLNYIASKILYLNPDYLGKLFKKECGIKFSDYLMKLRMEKAKQLLITAGDLKMYEVARRVGFGDNVAYFGQVFRKYTGLLPSEYRTKYGQT
ncbi:MAG: helix-turn-helix domain-containing protein, partial [Firmicutes bacterium]|nr:helix-turn-helix domain-containing protein [Bacillota bacterium]